MFVAQAQVKTDKAAAYLVQLCKHFAHKASAQYDDSQGRVDFQPGLCVMRARGDELTLRCEAASEQILDRVKLVVGDHLVRFAWREELAVTWVTGAKGATEVALSLR